MAGDDQEKRIVTLENQVKRLERLIEAVAKEAEVEGALEEVRASDAERGRQRNEKLSRATRGNRY